MKTVEGYWNGVLDRMVRTSAQFAAATGLLDVGQSAWDVDWRLYVGAAVTGAVFSFVTSMMTTGLGRKGTVELTESSIPKP